MTVVNRVATEEFTVKIGNSYRTFPANTDVAIPINLADMDVNFWGKDAHMFNMQRTGLVQNSAVFNGVLLDDTTFPDRRDNSNRPCPGKWWAMEIAVGVIQRLGKVRREVYNIELEKGAWKEDAQFNDAGSVGPPPAIGDRRRRSLID